MCFADNNFSSGLKTVNPELASDYIRRVDNGQVSWDRFHSYSKRDLKIFYLTRRLAGLSIDPNEYRKIFDGSIWDDFEGQLHSFFDANLITNTGNEIVPLANGMFYADSMVSLLVESLKSGFFKSQVAPGSGSNKEGHM